MKIQVTWDFDLDHEEGSTSFVRAHIEKAVEVGVPVIFRLEEYDECDDLEEDEITDWLSDTWGWCVLGWKEI